MGKKTFPRIRRAAPELTPSRYPLAGKSRITPVGSVWETRWGAFALANRQDGALAERLGLPLSAMTRGRGPETEEASTGTSSSFSSGRFPSPREGLGPWRRARRPAGPTQPSGDTSGRRCRSVYTADACLTENMAIAQFQDVHGGRDSK